MMKQDVELANKEWRDEEINSDRHIENDTGMLQYGRPFENRVYLLIWYFWRYHCQPFCEDLMGMFCNLLYRWCPTIIQPTHGSWGIEQQLLENLGVQIVQIDVGNYSSYVVDGPMGWWVDHCGHSKNCDGLGSTSLIHYTTYIGGWISIHYLVWVHQGSSLLTHTHMSLKG